MPLVSHSRFRPPWWLAGAHLQTLWPALGRRIPTDHWRRERLELADGDFLDLDWSPALLPPRARSRRLAIVSHGLEGNSRRPYVAGLIRTLNQSGWDAVAWNFRGCSGEPNRTPRAYHSGSSDDLALVVDHVARSVGPSGDIELALVGFSLGGNVTLKYLGERAEAAGLVRRAVVFSVPCDLAAAAGVMAQSAGRPYLNHFLRSLRAKAVEKVRRHGTSMPAITRETCWSQVRTFRDFDDCFTAPVHGFRDAADYWARCSSKPLLHRIAVPALIINAADDPFLSPECHPFALAAENPNLWLETPQHGGHVGFRGAGDRQSYWHERRALEFLGQD